VPGLAISNDDVCIHVPSALLESEAYLLEGEKKKTTQ
jgi:hypothetical protein